MKRSTVFITYEEAVFVHAQLLENFGGTAGLRDPGLLESALARPRSGYYESLSVQAAALMQSLARNHSFIDGNKRLAYGLAAVFLRANGWKLRGDPDHAERFIIDRVITCHADIEEIATWIEAHLEKS